MPEAKHGGCYDCGSLEHEILKSVTATRTAINHRTQKPSTTTGSIALCGPCYDKEMAKGKK